MSDHYGNPPAGEVRHYGEPGHFCGGDRCVWHLHTHVNGWCVSSVGEYKPKSHDNSSWEPLGAAHDDRGGRIYETMVFPSVGDGHPDRWTSYTMKPAWSREEADENHAAIVEYMKTCDVKRWLSRRMAERAAEAAELEEAATKCQDAAWAINETMTALSHHVLAAIYKPRKTRKVQS